MTRADEAFSLLRTIARPADLRALPEAQLEELARELRQFRPDAKVYAVLSVLIDSVVRKNIIGIFMPDRNTVSAVAVR